jgi:hypothetical protein
MERFVMIPADEVKTIVTRAVEEALAAHDGKPALLDRTGLARALTCSPSHVDNLRKKGLPTVFVGDAPRFVLTEVVDWLRKQDKGS